MRNTSEMLSLTAPRSSDDHALSALIERCSARDAAALEELYTSVSPLLLGCLMRMLRRRALAEEALQDVFIAVWQRASQFDEYRGRAAAWLIGIARYRAIDILRRERLEYTAPALLEARAEADSDAGDASEQFRFASQAALERCLARLSPEQRDSIRLAFVDGLSHDEVAGRMSRPLGTVKSWIRRGLAALKECLTPCAAQTTD